jgi:hypothetical protein
MLVKNCCFSSVPEGLILWHQRAAHCSGCLSICSFSTDVWASIFYLLSIYVAAWLILTPIYNVNMQIDGHVSSQGQIRRHRWALEPRCTEYYAMSNGSYWSKCEWKPPSEVVGDCALVPGRVKGGSERGHRQPGACSSDALLRLRNPQERVQGISTLWQ